jgi:hypothetical protein
MNVTIDYLNFESVIVMKTIDTYFDEKPVPDITFKFEVSDLSSEKIINILRILKLEYRNNYIKNEFQAIYQEIKLLIDCKIIKNEKYVNCESIRNPSIDFIFTYLKSSKKVHNLIKKKYHFVNESLIENLPKDNCDLILQFPKFNSRTIVSNNNYLQRILSSDKSYWKQTPIIQISTNSMVENLKFSLRKAYLENELFSDFQWNQNYYLAKKSFEFLETPYESRCSYYDSIETKLNFGSLSHKQCIRQCLRHYCEIEMNCSCFIYKHFNYHKIIFSQLDSVSNNLNICPNDSIIINHFYPKYSKLCTNLCPINCINDAYIISNKYQNQILNFDPNQRNISLFWYNSKPLILNKETPVMTFTDYFCYIGGLFGMWFGISANQLLTKLRDNYFIYYRTLIHVCLILFYILLEILFIIKTKFLSVIRNF